MNSDKLVIGLAGMPGSGKSLVVGVARELKYDIVAMGDVVREETLKRYSELTPKNVGKTMLQLRSENGNYVVAQKCVPKIEQQASDKVLVDGLRSLYEADIFKENFQKFVLVAVHAAPQTRFNRLFNRHRSDDPPNIEVFNDRDVRELGVGLGNVIAMAEKILVNDNSIEQFKAQAKDNLRWIEDKWLK